ncbi:hypothetical protein MCC10033_0289 [Bifidobacterium longum subsp. longum]|uniref:hypothetical protein n=1 Tax=Bifidobacterium longum TaxID=216816 RepID=UPI0010DB1AF3|nr:hypothetical protein [Bifidobacterium longum]TCE25099.1 hypothetical protein MCC10033_0289 [Bifidobacterium longum subsp. longum]
MRNGRPWAVRIMPAFVCVFAAFVVGYGLGEQAPLGEQDVQTVTQEVRQTGDVKRLCMTVKTGRAHRRHELRAHRPAERRRQMRPRLTYAQKSVLLQLVNHGDMQPADGNHKRTFQSLEERGYTQDVGYGRYAITEAGRRALQKDLS